MEYEMTRGAAFDNLTEEDIIAWWWIFALYEMNDQTINLMRVWGF